MGSPMLTRAVSSCFNLEYTTSLKSYFLILGYVNFKREVNLRSATCNRAMLSASVSFQGILKIPFICRELWARSVDSHASGHFPSEPLVPDVGQSHSEVRATIFCWFLLRGSLRLAPNPGFPCLYLPSLNVPHPGRLAFFFLVFRGRLGFVLFLFFVFITGRLLLYCLGWT